MHPFLVGQEYERPYLLDFMGSKQLQTGVIWGDKQPGCLIVTSGGRHGKRVGYSDQPLANGCWWYFGQGQDGDHDGQNPANKRLIEGQHGAAREDTTLTMDDIAWLKLPFLI
jgi:5-methylcytosine-specific restriction protein A